MGVHRNGLTPERRPATITVMGKSRWQTQRVAAWVLVLALASVSSVVCLAGSWQTSRQDECTKAMAHSGDSNAKRLDCCVADAPNFDVSLASVAAVPPPSLTLVPAGLFGVTPPGAHLSSSAAPDSVVPKPSSTPTYLLDSVFRI